MYPRFNIERKMLKLKVYHVRDKKLSWCWQTAWRV